MEPTVNQKQRLENLLSKEMYRKIIQEQAVNSFCTVETSTGHGRWTAEWEVVLDCSFDERLSTPILLKSISTTFLAVTDPNGEVWEHTKEFHNSISSKLFELCM